MSKIVLKAFLAVFMTLTILSAGSTSYAGLLDEIRNITDSYDPNMPEFGSAEIQEFEPIIQINIETPSIGDLVCSDWAKAELNTAVDLGLIPTCLEGKDLTKAITRAEFAAVSVKTYEALSGTAAIPAINNPFKDTNDVEVLKALNVGITSGVSATSFGPDILLNREQAATMLTRVFKKISLVGWTLQTDEKFTLPYDKPAPFADDSDISDWAKDSVYFMASNGIIYGVSNNNFAPKNVTPEQQAKSYANATREQALVIAVRMVENLR